MAPQAEAAPEHFDVLIVGAGLSGIGAAYHLQRNCPGKTYAILEGRDAERGHLGSVPLSGDPLGLGHVHARLLFPSLDARPRRSPTAPSILEYVRETAAEAGIDSKIRYNHRVMRAEWSSRRRALDGRRRASATTATDVGL